MDTVPGDTFIAECARFIRYNEARLGNVAGPSSLSVSAAAAAVGTWINPVSWVAWPVAGSAPEARTTTTGTATRDGSRLPAPASRRQTSTPQQQQQQRPMPLRVSSHHLYYLLLRCEALGLSIGQLDVRIPSASRPASYFAFISRHAAGAGTRRKDKDDTMSVSSLQTTMSTLTSLGGAGRHHSSSSWWSSAKQDPNSNLRYIYSAITKIPAVRIIPPPLKTIRDFEDCPGDMSVPLDAFKNVQILEFEDADPRGFIGWDRLSYQLRSLSMKGSGVEDVADLIIDAVINDGKRRRGEPVGPRRRKVHAPKGADDRAADTTASSAETNGDGAGSSSAAEATAPQLPSLSWHFLRHLGLADNSLTFLHSRPISCISSLTSLDLSNNLLNAVPPCLHLLSNLRSLNVSNNLIDSVLGIPAALTSIEALNLSRNRLESLCGLERLNTLSRIDLRHNEVFEAGEIGRLATLDHLCEVYTLDNPLYEEEGDARVLIFVEFAREGRALDALKLDDETAGYFERQRVREHVPNMDRLVQARLTRQGQIGDVSDSQIDSVATATAKPKVTATATGTTSAAQTRKDGVAAAPPTSSPSGPAIKNVRHRGAGGGSRHGARHGARVEAEQDGNSAAPSASNMAAAQRRNRRIVELSDSVRGIVDADADAARGTAETSGSDRRKGIALAPEVDEPTDSDAIKRAAREGNVEMAMGTSADTSVEPRAAGGRAEDGSPDEAGRRARTTTATAGAQTEPAALRSPSKRAQKGRKSRATGAADVSKEPPQDGGKSSLGAGQGQAGEIETGEDLRRRIEALKGEVGDDWMRLLARGESIYVPRREADDDEQEDDAAAAAAAAAAASKGHAR